MRTANPLVKEDVMAKNILVVHASPRVDGNSSMLADEFMKGAEAVGNTVTRVNVGRAKMCGCMACEYCFSTTVHAASRMPCRNSIRSCAS